MNLTLEMFIFWSFQTKEEEGEWEKIILSNCMIYNNSILYLGIVLSSPSAASGSSTIKRGGIRQSSVDPSAPSGPGPGLIAKYSINIFSIYVWIVMRKGQK